MLPSTDITGIAHVIQMAVAPVFLLTGVAGLLSVLVNRQQPGHAGQQIGRAHV